MTPSLPPDRQEPGAATRYGLPSGSAPGSIHNGQPCLLLEAGCSLISVGHRPSLRAFHRRELRLDGRGGWQLLAIEH